jgi:hypothetical protein
VEWYTLFSVKKISPISCLVGHLCLGSDFRWTNGQLRKKEANNSFVLPAMKTLCLFKVFPMRLQLGKACLRIHMSLKSHKPSSCVWCAGWSGYAIEYNSTYDKNAHLLIRTGGYLILYYVFQKPKTKGSGKKSRNHPKLTWSPSVIVDNEFILFGDILPNISH